MIGKFQQFQNTYSINKKNKQLTSVRMKKKREQMKMRKQQELNYVQSWSPHNEIKQYNALKDPHANYYFYNKSVSEHLKELKKAINKEKNEKQKQKIKDLINSKLNLLKLPHIKVPPKTVLYSSKINQQFDSITLKQRKKSEFALAAQSKSKTNKNQVSFSVSQMKRYKIPSKGMKSPYYSIQDIKNSNLEARYSEKQGSARNYYTNDKQVQKIHEDSHRNFMQFIARKRNLISQNIMKTEKESNQRIENGQIDK